MSASSGGERSRVVFLGARGGGKLESRSVANGWMMMRTPRENPAEKKISCTTDKTELQEENAAVL